MLNKMLAWILVILWMSLIFYLSHQPATESAQLSTGITEVIIQTLEKIAPSLQFDIRNFNHLVRKNAHFFAYLILGLLVINALRRSKRSGMPSVALALGICFLYAVSDEVHQLFVPGRSGEMRDVWIDTAGASVGIGMYLAFGRMRSRKKKNRGRMGV